MNQKNQLTASRVVEGVERLTLSLPLLREDPEARRFAEKALPHLEQPARAEEIAVLSAVLLEPYFSKDTAPEIKTLEAELWCDGLSEYPLWALKRAVAWWHSAENKQRHRRPVFGDIEERARIFTGPLRAARTYLSLPPKGPKEPEEERKMTPEEIKARREYAEAVMKRTGFKK